MPKSDLPFGSEFTPSTISLRRLLELAHTHNGSRKAFLAAVREEYFEARDTSESNKRKLMDNTGISMANYGLIDTSGTLTDLGNELYSLREDESLLHQRFAQHILLNLNGTLFVQCIQDMQAAGQVVELVGLRKALAERNILVPSAGKHMSSMRLWLEKAGIFADGYRIDVAAFERILGTGAKEIESLAGLSPEQRSYLKALVNLGGGGPYSSSEIQRLATATYGTEFNEKSLPQTVLHQLRDAGFITLERGTREAGRGAKPFLVTTTDKMTTDVLNPLLEQFESQIDPQVRALIRRPLNDILNSLNATDANGDPDKHGRGLALEALAFKLMRVIDLSYLATRLRGTSTGGAEVDVIFESSRLVFSRWQVQCKNTARVALDDVAKEVGLTHLLKSNVIVMISTGEIGPEARNYANKVMTDTNLCIVMITRADIGQIAQNQVYIIDVLNREARHAMKIKAISV